MFINLNYGKNRQIMYIKIMRKDINRNIFVFDYLIFFLLYVLYFLRNKVIFLRNNLIYFFNNFKNINIK